MANNTNAQAILWCNNVLRPGTNAIVSAYLTAQRMVASWSDAAVYNVIPSDSNLIQDGSTTDGTTVPDGRPPITDAQVNQILNDLNAFITFCGTNSFITQIDAVATNPKSAV